MPLIRTVSYYRKDSPLHKARISCGRRRNGEYTVKISFRNDGAPHPHDSEETLYGKALNFALNLVKYNNFIPCRSQPQPQSER